MQYTSIKNICQVSINALVLGFFCFFPVYSAMAQNGVAANVAKLREQAAKEIENLIEQSIEAAKKGALAELKTGEYKKLYESNDPGDIAQRQRIESAVITLIDANRSVIYASIIEACRKSAAEIAECDPKSRAEAAGKIIDSILRNVAEARENGTRKLDEMIAVTEAHTAQQAAIERIAANIAQLNAARDQLAAKKALVEGYIAETKDVIANAGVFNMRIFVLQDLKDGLRDLQNALTGIVRAMDSVRNTSNDLAAIKWKLENRAVKPEEVNTLLAGARKDLLAVQVNTDFIVSVLNRESLAWLVGKYNELNPTKPIDLAQMRKDVDAQLAPLASIIKGLEGKEMKAMLEKLKAALLVPGVDPKKPLTDSLKIDVPTSPKPNGPSSNPSGSIIGVDDVPVWSNPPSSGNRPPIAVPPPLVAPPDNARIVLVGDGRGGPLRQRDGSFVFYYAADPAKTRYSTGPDGTQTISGSLPDIRTGAVPFIYVDPADGKRKIDVYVPPDKRAEIQNGTMK